MAAERSASASAFAFESHVAREDDADDADVDADKAPLANSTTNSPSAHTIGRMAKNVPPLLRPEIRL